MSSERLKNTLLNWGGRSFSVGSSYHPFTNSFYPLLIKRNINGASHTCTGTHTHTSHNACGWRSREELPPLWLHHWTRMWSSEEIQTFWNLSLNKLASLRAADRPFIVAGTGPMASVDRAAVLWFPVWATMIDVFQRGRRQHSLSPPPPPSLHLSAHWFNHASTFMALRGHGGEQS